MNRLVKTAALAAMGIFSVAAQAATITFDFTPDVASGKTSPFAGNPGIFIETLDKADGTCGLTGAGFGGVDPSSMTGITGGPFAFTKGPVGTIAAPPLNDGTCYAYAPAPGGFGSLPTDLSDIPLPAGVSPSKVLASVTIDYANVIDTLTGGQYLNYFGLYYGSIDAFNMIEFFDANGARIETVYGSQIIAKCSPGCAPGSQNAEGTNQYVNVILDEGETFRSLRFTTWGIAVEVDNFAVGVGVAQVPEPGSLALIGLGLAGLAAARRRKKA